MRRHKRSELERQILAVLFVFVVTAGAVYLFATTHRTIIAAQPARPYVSAGED